MALNEPLTGDFNRLTARITAYGESIKKNISNLEARINPKKEVTGNKFEEINGLKKEIGEDLTEMKECIDKFSGLKLSNTEMKNKKNKIEKESLEIYWSLNDKLTNINKNLQKMKISIISSNSNDSNFMFQQPNPPYQGTSTKNGVKQSLVFIEKDLEEDVMEEREQHINQIDRLAKNVNEFTKIQNTTVKDQGVKIDQIAKNVIVAEDNTKKANQELMQAKKNTQKSRKSILIFGCGIIVVLALIVLVVLATSGVFH